MIWFYTVIYFIAGACAGSFVNAWVWRTRENLAIVASRSMCPNCRERIWNRDNIPILGFLFLAGRCRHCRNRISWQYPLVEIAAGGLFVLAAFSAGPSGIPLLRLLCDWILLIFLLTIFIYDLRFGEILDQTTTIPAIILIPVALATGWQSWHSLLFGVIAGAGLFFAFYVMSRGAWIGGGDVRLGFFMGVILGWPLILLALLIAYILGAIWSMALIMLRRKTFQSATPFGTYLVVGTIVSMFYGNELIAWYLGLM